ncbi:MAG: hypothetical protein AB7P23_11100 [Amphiplicatus sp.]
MTTALSNRADLRFTIVVSGALVVQTALALLWAGAAAERLNQLERRADASAEILERTTRLEEQMGAVKASLLRIETKIDRRNGEER